MKHLTQLEEKVPQGIPPLLIDSSTLVTNLNADLLDGNHASAFATTAHTHAVATPSTSGFMSATDKTKLDSLEGSLTLGNYRINYNGTTDKLEFLYIG